MWNISVGRFSFGVLASLIFVVYFVIFLFTSTNNSMKHSGVISEFYTLSPILNGIQQVEYTVNT